MESLQTKQDLQNAILHLEQRQLLEKNAMQLHYREAQEYLQPSNLLKNLPGGPSVTHTETTRTSIEQVGEDIN